MSIVPQSNPNIEDILSDESLLDDIGHGYMCVYAGGPLSTLGTKENPITYSNRGIQLDPTIPAIVSQHAKYVLKREQSQLRRTKWLAQNNRIPLVSNYLAAGAEVYDDGERIELPEHLDFARDVLVPDQEALGLGIVQEALERMERRPYYTGTIAQFHPAVQPVIARLTNTTPVFTIAVYEKLQKFEVPVTLERRRASTEIPYVA